MVLYSFSTNERVYIMDWNWRSQSSCSIFHYTTCLTATGIYLSYGLYKTITCMVLVWTYFIVMMGYTLGHKFWQSWNKEFYSRKLFWSLYLKPNLFLYKLHIIYLKCYNQFTTSPGKWCTWCTWNVKHSTNNWFVRVFGIYFLKSWGLL